MPEDWYPTIAAGTRITQGDLIFGCPLIGWKDEPPQFSGGSETEILRQSMDAFLMDAVVMTQACDLETLLLNRNQPRLRLLPPYREHLSQAFARFFMRVGLPVAVATAW